MTDPAPSEGQGDEQPERRNDLSDWPSPPSRAAPILLSVVGVILLFPSICTIGFFIESGLTGFNLSEPGGDLIIKMVVGSLLSGALGLFLLRLARRNRRPS